MLWDNSEDALARARGLAEEWGVSAEFVRVDLEQEGVNPLPPDTFGAILVFRYLHRPLVPCIKKGLKEGGLLFYETFTIDQPPFGKPRNPDFLLESGELPGWFQDWEVIHSFEGILDRPKRAVAQIVCRKPRKYQKSFPGIAGGFDPRVNLKDIPL
jgi:SAM-dependent methyltransferase